MLRPRIIPCLLVHNKGLVKTVNFRDPKYVGDPINAVRIFNEKRVDELMVLDIDASVQNREPDYKLIELLAAECRMPLSYGGGVKTVDQAKRIFSLGVEKIAFSSAFVSNPGLISELATVVGAQSVVAVIDCMKGRKSYEIYTHNAKKYVKHNLVDLVRSVEANGAGEIVINSIDRDGTMKGYDLDLVKIVREATKLPLTFLGGAGSLQDIGKLIELSGTVGAAAGSLFVFKGVYRAVLISYPSSQEKSELFKTHLKNLN